MDFNTISQAITTMGFPIVSCICLAWYVKHQTDENKKEVKEIREEHTKEMKEVTTALNNNTVAITKLCERIGSIVGKDEV